MLNRIKIGDFLLVKSLERYERVVQVVEIYKGSVDFVLDCIEYYDNKQIGLCYVRSKDILGKIEMFEPKEGVNNE